MRAVPALQQLRRRGTGGFNRGPGHRGSPALSHSGGGHLLYTQVRNRQNSPGKSANVVRSCVDVVSLVHWQEAESQTAEPAEHSAALLEGSIQGVTSLLVCVVFDCGTRRMFLC